MIGITVTSIVKLISCTIILEIAQRQAPFRQCNVNVTEHMLFFCQLF